jgi:hypothetical protein
MKSINDLPLWDKDALMAWVFDLEEQIFKMKRKRTEEFFMNIPHETRRDSHAAASRNAADRRRVILEILAESENGMTAREIAGELHRRGITPTEERNYAAPRLTELNKDGKVNFTSKKLCPLTRRYVAVWTVRG